MARLGVNASRYRARVRVKGKSTTKWYVRKAKTMGLFVEFEADGERFSLASLLGPHPRRTGFGVWSRRKLSLRGVRSWSANVMFGIGPVEADKGRPCVRGFLLPV